MKEKEPTQTPTAVPDQPLGQPAGEAIHHVSIKGGGNDHSNHHNQQQQCAIYGKTMHDMYVVYGPLLDLE